MTCVRGYIDGMGGKSNMDDDDDRNAQCDGVLICGFKKGVIFGTLYELSHMAHPYTQHLHTHAQLINMQAYPCKHDQGTHNREKRERYR